MRGFVEWIEDPKKGFYVRESWDEKKGKMVHGGKLKLTPHQKLILGKALTPNEEGEFPYITILYSCIKKSGKSTLGAAVAAWYADEAPGGTEIYIVANSLESAEGRVMRDVKYHMQRARTDVKTTNYKVEFPNDTYIQAISQAYKSAAGSRHALTVWDELWGYSSELDIRMWDEMTPIPTVPNSLRFIATYAGFRNESKLLWDLYLQGVGQELEEKGKGTLLKDMDGLPVWENGSLFTYWDSEPRMPWQTPDYYEEQQKSLRPAAYLRLHMNAWVTTHEEFIPVEWFDEAAQVYEADADLWDAHPFKYWPLYVGVDAGVKHDCTAIVAVGYDAERAKLGIVKHKIWTPKPDEWFDLDSTVEHFLKDLYHRYKIASIVYDRTQLHQTMTRLHFAGFPVHEFSQSSKMIEASQLLYDLFKNKKVEAYEDEELRKHIQMARAEVTPRGFKISKSRLDRTMQHKDDAAVALAMAAYAAITEGGVDISVPVVIESPFSDMQVNRTKEDGWLPFELRSDD